MSVARSGRVSSSLAVVGLLLSRDAFAQGRPPVPLPGPFTTCAVAPVVGLPSQPLPPVTWRPSTTACNGPSHALTAQELAIQSNFNAATHRDMRAVPLGRSVAGHDLAVGAAAAPQVITRASLDPALYSSRFQILQSASSQSPLLGLIASIGPLLWEANGNRMDSCAEYVSERFYDASAVGTTLRQSGTDFRAAFNAMYGPTGNPASVGSRAICLNSNHDELYSRDRNFTFGRMFGGGAAGHAYLSSRNAFKNGVPIVGSGGEQIPGWLVDWWTAHTTQDTPPGGVNVSWQWHLDRSNEMRTMHRYAAAEVAPDATHRCGGTRSTGYTDEELNYLYDLQVRYQNLFGSLQYAVPVVTAGEPNPLGWIDAIINPDPFVSTFDAQREVLGVGLTPTFGIVPSPGGAAIAPSIGRPRIYPAEFTSGIATELYSLLQEAERWGCLGPSPTPCDWSPKFFVSTLGDRFTSQENDAQRECQQRVYNANNFSQARPTPLVTEYTPTLLVANASGRPHGASWFDSIEIPCNAGLGTCAGLPAGTASTRWQASWNLGDLAATTVSMWRPQDDTAPLFNNAALRDVRTNTQPECNSPTFIGRSRCFDAFLAEGTVHRALGILGNIAPELVENGHLRLPGRTRTYASSLGNDYFGVDYSFSAGYQLLGANNADRAHAFRNVPAGTPGRVGMRTTASLTSKVTVFGHDYPIASGSIDASLDGATSTPFQIRDAFISTTCDTPGCSAPNYTFTAEGSQSREVIDPEYSATVVVLGVPITMSLGATGRVGLGGTATASGPTGGELDYAARMATAITPILSAEGHAEAYANLGIARAGVKGRLTLVSVEIPIGATMETAPSVHGPGIRIHNGASVRLSTLSGRLAAFVEVDLGIWSDSAEAEILSWNGPSVSENIFSSDYTLPLDLMRAVPWY